MSAKEEIVQIALSTEDDILILDPESEFGYLTEADVYKRQRPACSHAPHGRCGADERGLAMLSLCLLYTSLGHTINFKTRKHFKDKKSHYVPEDECTIFENTHEAIIDQQTFDLVQKIRGNVRRYPISYTHLDVYKRQESRYSRYSRFSCSAQASWSFWYLLQHRRTSTKICPSKK